MTKLRSSQNMCDPLVKIFGKDLALEVYRHVHQVFLSQVHLEYFVLFRQSYWNHSIGFKGLDNLAILFYFNYRDCRERDQLYRRKICTWKATWETDTLNFFLPPNW